MNSTIRYPLPLSEGVRQHPPSSEDVRLNQPSSGTARNDLPGSGAQHRDRLAAGNVIDQLPSAEVAAVPVDPTAAESAAAVADLQAHLGLVFQDPDLLLTALTHPSYANEHPEDDTEHNERLEFLGDAVLGMIVARTLYQRFPEVSEGRLTEWRAFLVCGPTLSRVARTLDLGRWLRLGRGEDQTGGRDREGNLERVFEAIVGAIYLDGGLEAARTFVRDSLASELAALETNPEALNPKGALQELVQQLQPDGEDGGLRPEYILVAETGPDHERHYEVSVAVEGETVGQGSGASKQQAEKEAASEALAWLRSRLDDADDPSRGATRGDGD